MDFLRTLDSSVGTEVIRYFWSGFLILKYVY